MHHLDRRKAVRRHAPLARLSVAVVMLAGAGLGVWAASQWNLAERTSTDTLSQSHLPPDPALPPSQSVLPASAPDTDVDVLVARLGEMQSELLRLNALGERLVKMSGLDSDDFDFSAPPPQGGPGNGPVRDYTIKELVSELGNMMDLIEDRSRKLERLEASLSQRNLRALALAPVWPVRSGYISSPYGYRIHPIRKTRQFHAGVDFAAKRGSPILAVADGVVDFSGWRKGYGRVIDIRHANGLVTRYAHNDANLVQVGQRVRKGEQIGKIGSSGLATGAHLHFEVLRDGKTQDPLTYLDSTPRPTTLAAVPGERAG